MEGAPAAADGCTALFPLAPLLPPGSRVRVADVGALSLGDGDAYSPLLRQHLCDVVGFEPAPGECERLNAAAAERPPGTGSLQFFPTFVGDGKPGTRRPRFQHQPPAPAPAPAPAASSPSSPAGSVAEQVCSG